MAVPSFPQLPSAQGLHFQESPLVLCALEWWCWTKPTLPAPAGAAEPPQPELSTLLLFLLLLFSLSLVLSIPAGDSTSGDFVLQMDVQVL